MEPCFLLNFEQLEISWKDLPRPVVSWSCAGVAVHKQVGRKGSSPMPVLEGRSMPMCQGTFNRGSQ